MNTTKAIVQELIVSLLDEYATYIPDEKIVDNQVVVDSTRGHFQLIRFEWNRDVLNHTIVFHFDIKPDGKIWIQINNTDVDIAAELVNRGIEKADIVIGFQPTRYRPYTGYAVA